MSSAPSRGTPLEMLTGYQNGTQNENIEGLTDQARLTLMLVSTNPNLQPYIPSVVDLLRCDDATWQSSYQIYRNGEPRDVVRRIHSTLFELPSGLWELMQQLQGDPQKHNFAFHLERLFKSEQESTQPSSTDFSAIQCGHSVAYQASTSSGNGTSGEVGANLNATNGDEHRSGAVHHVPLSEQVNNAHHINSQAKQSDSTNRHKPSRSLKPPSNHFFCAVPGCSHSHIENGGYSKKGYCKNHIRNDHETFVASNVDWQSYIMDVSAPYYAGSQTATKSNFPNNVGGFPQTPDRASHVHDRSNSNWNQSPGTQVSESGTDVSSLQDTSLSASFLDTGTLGQMDNAGSMQNFGQWVQLAPTSSNSTSNPDIVVTPSEQRTPTPAAGRSVPMEYGLGEQYAGRSAWNYGRWA